MLRNLGIRSKLLAVLAVPLIVLIALSSIVVAGAAQTAQRADRVRQLTAAAGLLDQYVHELQRERSLTATYLVTGNAKVKAELDAQRKVTTQRLLAVRAAVSKAPVAAISPTFADAVAKATATDDELPTIRAEVDARKTPAATLLGFYSSTIALDLGMTDLVALTSQSPELTRELQAYSALSHAIEAAWQERDLGTAVISAKKITEQQYFSFAGLVSIQQAQLSTFAQLADPALAGQLHKALGSDAAMQAARQQVDSLLATGKAPAKPAWPTVADDRIAAMTSVEPAIVAGLASTATDATNSAKIKAVATGFGTLTAILILLILAVMVVRRIVGPIRRLTAAATDTARKLPQMVDEMQTPGQRPDVELPKIMVDSDDEIGGLADAFNVVNDVTMRVAHEQVALRASIAEMFVNVARRNQVLLTRQLNLIDQMEAHEEDPDTLENLFRVDHLATRMRRNAESLLVLAGIDASRRLRQAMPLTDVIRSAVSEIENFDRVDLAPAMDAPLTGRYAMTAAHLLAELIENATHFSNPDTRVIVATGPTRDGIEVTITDYGLGMSEKELAEANDRIARPPVTEIAISQRLGFLVVGRLAQRLEAKVSLRRGRTAGTVVAVSLPSEVFVPGSLPHVRPAEAPAPSDDDRAEHAEVDAEDAADEAALEAAVPAHALTASEAGYQPEQAFPPSVDGAGAAVSDHVAMPAEPGVALPLPTPDLPMPTAYVAPDQPGEPIAMPELPLPSRARRGFGGDAGSDEPVEPAEPAEAAPSFGLEPDGVEPVSWADASAFDEVVSDSDTEPGEETAGDVYGVDAASFLGQMPSQHVDAEDGSPEPEPEPEPVAEADAVVASEESAPERQSLFEAFLPHRRHRKPDAAETEAEPESAQAVVEDPVEASTPFGDLSDEPDTAVWEWATEDVAVESPVGEPDGVEPVSWADASAFDQVASDSDAEPGEETAGDVYGVDAASFLGQMPSQHVDAETVEDGSAEPEPVAEKDVVAEAETEESAPARPSLFAAFLPRRRHRKPEAAETEAAETEAAETEAAETEAEPESAQAVVEDVAAVESVEEPAAPAEVPEPVAESVEAEATADVAPAVEASSPFADLSDEPDTAVWEWATEDIAVEAPADEHDGAESAEPVEAVEPGGFVDAPEGDVEGEPQAFDLTETLNQPDGAEQAWTALTELSEEPVDLEPADAEPEPVDAAAPAHDPDVEDEPAEPSAVEASHHATVEVDEVQDVEPSATEDVEPSATEDVEPSATDEAEPSATEDAEPEAVDTQLADSDRISSATAQLRALAVTQEAEPEEGQDEPAVEAEAESQAEDDAEVEPAPPTYSGTPAMDILPGRHRAPKRGLFHRRHREEPAPAPARTSAERDLPKRAAAAPAPKPAVVERPAAVEPFVAPWAAAEAAPQPTAPAEPADGQPEGYAAEPSPFAGPDDASTPVSPSTTVEPAAWTPTLEDPAEPAAPWQSPAPVEPADEPVPAGVGLRGSPFAELAAERHLAPAEPAPAEPAPREATPEPEPTGGAELMAARSQLASQALSELSRLNSSLYSPTEAQGGPAPLTRRVSRADSVPPPAPAESARPRRTADEVRSRLAGFRAGVERGRSASSSNHSKS